MKEKVFTGRENFQDFIVSLEANKTNSQKVRVFLNKISKLGFVRKSEKNTTDDFVNVDELAEKLNFTKKIALLRIPFIWNLGFLNMKRILN